MIEVSKVIKDYDPPRRKFFSLKKADSAPQRAVDGISFECKPGRIFSLLGPNGAGKTTTLRMIATILRPGSGQITVAGHDVMQHPNMVRRNIGFLTGATGLYARLTPNEMIRYFADLNGIAPAEFRVRKEALFTSLKMHDFANKKIGSLSTGMKQKVSIARTMIHNPPVVVFDEPTSGLDVITASAIIDLIRQCKQEQKTVIFSSHIMSEVELLCDDLAIMHKGKLIFYGTMSEFRAQMQTANITEDFIRLVHQNDPTSA